MAKKGETSGCFVKITSLLSLPVIGVFLSWLFASPDIVKFQIEPTEIKSGERVNLEWEVKNAKRVEILPKSGEFWASGTFSDKPLKTTTYILTVRKWCITRKWCIFDNAVGHEVVVKPATEHQARGSYTVSFANYPGTLFLKGDEFAEQGIREITPARPYLEDPGGTESDYCKNTQPAILPAGTYESPFSFLTTATPGRALHCNTLPLAIYFTEPVKEVFLHFSGGEIAYELIAFRSDGSEVTKNATNAHYDHQNYEISVRSPTANIAWITFGVVISDDFHAVLTTIRDVEFMP